MARNQYSFKKRQKELARKKKKEDKMKRKAEKLEMRIPGDEDMTKDSSDPEE